jgi:uncharacterized protein YgbK (DUF1537 family)
MKADLPVTCHLSPITCHPSPITCQRMKADLPVTCHPSPKSVSSMSLTTPALIIVADDLTGAADCAARCRGVGLPATIFLDTPAAPLPAGVVAFSTDSRHLSPEAAQQRVIGALSKLSGRRVPRWYKKIDSTLRGNIGAELAAMVVALTGQPAAESFVARRRLRALVCPAFPAHQRGLLDGYLVMGDAQRLQHLPTLLTTQAPSLVNALVDLNTVRAGHEQLVAALMHLDALGIDVAVIDALTEDDLLRVLLVAERALPNALLCGSAGLVGVLAQRLAQQRGDLVAPQFPSLHVDGPTLAVVGSASVMAQRQVAAVQSAGVARVLCIEDETNPEGLADLVLAAPGNWVIHLPAPSPTLALDSAEARITARRLADAALMAIGALRPARLILCGGDSAQAVLSALGIERLSVEQEQFAGMPLASGFDATGRSWQVILKAGNHGDEMTLVRLIGGG